MKSRRVDVLLIGGGAASVAAAATLREEGFAGSILLVGRELDPPYRRPPLTKSYLQGREARDDVYLRTPEWWDENDVELLIRTSVVGIDPEASTAKLSTKETVEFGHALIATGSKIRRLQLDGSECSGIHYVRTPGNADALRQDLRDAKRVICIGGSYIASEVAAALIDLGYPVTLVMEEARLMERLGPAVSTYVTEQLESRGAEVIGEEAIVRFIGTDGRVAGVETGRGRTIDADVVVCGVGALPESGLANRAGLSLGPTGGVLCDVGLRTSAPNIFAAGDICEFESVLHGLPVRIEHEDAALEQGATAARNMIGDGGPHLAVPYFFSHLSDWATIECLSTSRTWDEEVVEGVPEEGSFTVWQKHGGRTVGMVTVGGHADVEAAKVSLSGALDSHTGAGA
jgi:3-phenylpropionate/trans-cinnamate dioxygenase ferredoxin reductase component